MTYIKPIIVLYMGVKMGETHSMSILIGDTIINHWIIGNHMYYYYN